MKRIFICLLACLLLMSLAACSKEDDTDLTDQVIVRSDATADEDEIETDAEDDTTEEDATVQVAAADTQGFTFVTDGVVLMPGQAFDADSLPEAENIYTVASCAGDGTDNVYTYESFEITAYDDGTGEVIYSIYLIDPNLSTVEGLTFGDTAQQVMDLYGQDYQQDGNAMVYTSNGTQLSIILQDDQVISIEYLLVL